MKAELGVSPEEDRPRRNGLLLIEYLEDERTYRASLVTADQNTQLAKFVSQEVNLAEHAVEELRKEREERLTKKQDKDGKIMGIEIDHIGKHGRRKSEREKRDEIQAEVRERRQEIDRMISERNERIRVLTGQETKPVVLKREGNSIIGVEVLNFKADEIEIEKAWRSLASNASGLADANKMYGDTLKVVSDVINLRHKMRRGGTDDEQREASDKYIALLSRLDEDAEDRKEIKVIFPILAGITKSFAE